MKRLTMAILFHSLVFFGVANADDNYPANLQDVGSAHMIDSQDKAESRPFRISARGDWFGQANIDKKHHRHQHVKFHAADIKGEAILYYNEAYEEGFGASIDYSNVYFKWNKNRYFNRSVFDQVSLTAFGFTKRACNWTWQASATLNMDTKYHNFSEYTNYDLVLWGRYEYCSNVGLHGGILALTGMKIDHIYPIIGFDWTINDCWKINAILPMNVSIVYTFAQNWSCALAGRFLEVRRRVGKHAHYKKGLIDYRNKGLELALDYESDWMNVNIHGGYAFGGQFVVSNHNNKRKHHFDLDSSGYFGGEVGMKF